ncbi:MAG: hypothetical protein PF795_03555 [Kiritimatiellae bacterium]|jgi:hypothetical protein|nr:hypothetical protein [Kiritimatiellia bacterium]
MNQAPPSDRRWTVHLIHHTHTDVGYTESQSRITRFHVDFIDRIIDIARDIRNGRRDLDGFVWTNECFWSIEQWLERNPDRTDDMIDAVRDGVLGLTGGYLHFNELIDGDMARASIGRAQTFSQKHNLPINTALHADINGFSRGYARTLLDAGIDNLVTCIHAHHGLAPLGKRQTPFFWETPDGGELFVWNGEHYHLGNTLGLMPGAMNTYDFRDELHPNPRGTNHREIAQRRLPAYLRQLEIDGYPYDIVPIHASGAMTDNAPPSTAVLPFVKDWNAKYPDIQLHMSTPSEFCRRVREVAVDLPRYRGDWPDWWSDGLSSTPSETRLARRANLQRRYLREVAVHQNLTPKPVDVQKLEQNLLLYCEHTFNHSDSTQSPWHLQVKAIGGNKKATACAAYDASMDIRDDLFAQLGELPNLPPLEAGDRFVYRVLNPLDVEVTDIAPLYLEHRDFDLVQTAPEVIDLRTGAPLPLRKTPAPRGFTFDVPLTLGPGGDTLLELRATTATLRHNQRVFSEGWNPDDVRGADTPANAPYADARGVETPYLRLQFDDRGRIISWMDKTTGTELLNTNRDHAPFTPVYEVTPEEDNPDSDKRTVRSHMGRNRKGENVQRFEGVPVKLHFPDSGGERLFVAMDYHVEGAARYRVQLAVWTQLPRVDVTVHLHKTSVWEAENFFVSLPFSVPGGTLWVDKSGGPTRPWIDQIPDTQTDWVCIQDGFCHCGPDTGVVVTTPDAPLLQLGPLAFGRRRLMGHPELDPADIRTYNWLMTNYWETNFDVDLGGFHECQYRIESGAALKDPQAALRHAGNLIHGFSPFRVAPPVS